MHHFVEMNEGKLQRLLKFEQTIVRNDKDEDITDLVINKPDELN